MSSKTKPKARPTPPQRRPVAKAAPPRRSRIILIVVGAAIVLAGGLAILQRTTSGSGKVDTANLQFVSEAKAAFAGLPSSGGVVGYGDAPVRIVEYGDLRCPNCRAFDAQVMPDVLTNLVRTHKARVEFRTWPILGQNSVFAARAAYAAQKQDKLWVYAMITFYNQGDETTNWFDDTTARAFATAAGLDVAQFDRDRASKAADAAIAAVDAQATAAKLTGTPTVFVEGPKGAKQLAGVPTYAQIAAAVTAQG